MGNICIPPYVPQIPLVRVNMIVGKGIAYFRQIAIITILDAWKVSKNVLVTFPDTYDLYVLITELQGTFSYHHNIPINPSTQRLH